MNRPAAILLTIACATALGGCFTGIESTPRINDPAGRHSQAAPSAEAAFFAAVRPEAPAAWRPGKKWVVTDDKIGIIFTPQINEPLRGDTITLAATGTSPTIMGGESVDLTFTLPDGRLATYATGMAAEEFKVRERHDIPFAVELSAVVTADSLLRDRLCYITTPLWYDAEGKARAGLRYVPARLQGVTPGTAVHPLLVTFTSDSLPGTHTVFLTYGSGTTATRNFDRLFSFTNPRDSYPRITDATWHLIVHSQVAEGMTRDECRLALGTPSDIRRGATTAAHIEQWTYDDGIYLIFEDGILTRFRR